MDALANSTLPLFLNQHILYMFHLKMVPLHIHIVAKGLWHITSGDLHYLSIYIHILTNDAK
jgi:hypothetical protein